MIPLDPVADSPLNPLADRIVAVIVLLSAAAFVWVLAATDPDPRGHGTHEQLGMEACGWVVHYQRPCPTCGVTTAAAHLVHLRPMQAVVTQPFGAALAGFGLWLAGAAGFCLLRGRSYLDYLLRLPQGRIMVWGLVLLLGSWLYKYLSFGS